MSAGKFMAMSGIVPISSQKAKQIRPNYSAIATKCRIIRPTSR